MSVLIKTKVLVQNKGRLLVLARSDKDSGIQYDFLSCEIQNKDNIQLEISKLVQKQIHIKPKSCKFFFNMPLNSASKSSFITLYYICEIDADVLKIESDYDSYYWLEIEDIIAQPVLPSWMKGAALLLSRKLKAQRQKEEYNQVYISEVLKALGAKKTQRAKSISFSINNKILCLINNDVIEVLYEEKLKPDFEYKVIVKKGNQWLQIEKSTSEIDKLKQYLIKIINS
ncbi:MAG TPA: hypothetical protein VIL26_00385 [Clostridia bacterium]